METPAESATHQERGSDALQGLGDARGLGAGARGELAAAVRRARELATRVVPAAYLVLCVLPYAAFLTRVRDPYATPTLHYVYPYVDLDAEANVAAWFSSALFLLCALTAAALVATHREHGLRARLPQAAVALLFLYLSMDETGRLHEFLDVMLAQRLAEGLTGRDVPNAARVWALFALPTLALVAAAFALLTRRTPLAARTPGACFLIGFGLWTLGLALEIAFGAPLWAAQRLTLYRLEVLAEETAEVGGTFLFLLGLLHALEAQLLASTAGLRSRERRLNFPRSTGL